MNKLLLKKLNHWYEEDAHDKIIDRFLEIPESDRDYDIISHLARAYNNLNYFEEAIEQLFLIKEKGIDDPLWHHRMGYACFYLENYEYALKEFKIAHNLDKNDQIIKSFLDMKKVHIFMKNNYLEEIDN
jgi:tetratricopeptide (TPR) repeat protein